MTGKAGHENVPMDEILQLHQNIHLLGPGVLKCLICCTNDNVITALLDGLATLCMLYEAARTRYWEASALGDVTCDNRAHVPLDAHPNPDDSTERTSEGINEHPVPSAQKSAPCAMPSVVLGRIQLMDSETNLVFVTLIRQGLRQTGSHLRDLQEHLTKCLMAKKMESSTYNVHKRRVVELLSRIYSSLACM